MSNTTSLAPTVHSPRRATRRWLDRPLLATWWRWWLAAPSRDDAWIR